MELDYPKTPDNFSLVMIYCKGKSVSDKGKTFKMSPPKEKSICIQLVLPEVLKMMDCP